MKTKTILIIFLATMMIGAFVVCTISCSEREKRVVKLRDTIGFEYFTDSTLLYSLISDDEVTVLECSDKHVTSVDIPSTIVYGEERYSVTSITGFAYTDELTALTSITIPSSVLEIEENAFEGCGSLASISVESGNKVYDSRNNCNAVIETKTNKLVVGCQSTQIPNTVTSIGEEAFSGSRNLVSITIPESVKTIGDYAFSYCSSLSSITIPKSVTSIGLMPFAQCSNLASISVENGNPIYDSRNDCNAIIETKTNTLIAGGINTQIPESVTAIDIGAFVGLSKMASISIPNSVKSIGWNAFNDCTGLKEIYSFIQKPFEMDTIDFDAFSGCYGATLYVPKDTKQLYQKAKGWTGFKNIVEME